MAILVSGMLPRVGNAAAGKSAAPPTLSQGDVVSARVSQLGPDGKGVMRMADGTGLSFSGGRGLVEGESIRLEVVRTVPEVFMRLAGSESGVAGKLATDVQQSLMRAPDLFGKLMQMGGLSGSGAKTALFPELGGLSALQAALKGGASASRFVTGRGEGIAQLLQQTLPNISLESLMKGDAGQLLKLMQGSSQQQLAEMVKTLHRAANTLQLADPAEAANPAAQNELSAARAALSRLGDLLTMQEVLPKVSAQPDGTQFLGYRVFWMQDGGMGEAMWRREGGRGGSDEDEVTSVLLNLNMSNLGPVRARLAFGKGQLSISIAAEDEEVLSTLRGGVGDLRQALIDAELPLQTLDLMRMFLPEIISERQEMLGMGNDGGFSLEA
ncbi:MAG: flagellar hook-length control protein FliK [Magnetococcales bacterium]|nr:flagellar hook-length control protein FliK [Magnetococcales bacterium]